MKQSYIRLLNLLQGTNDLGIDSVAEKLLELIAVAHASGKPLTVTEAMNFGNIASPATLHRKLNQLIEAELVSQDFEGKNRRTKFLSPTAKANRHFEKVGKLIRAAAKG